MDEMRKLSNAMFDMLHIFRLLKQTKKQSIKKAKVLSAVMMLDNGFRDLPFEDRHIIRSTFRDYWNQYLSPKEEMEHEKYYEGMDHRILD